jgi:hypothetical protein
MVALVRYAIDGWAIQRALAEGQRLNGGAPLAREQVEWLLGWAGRHLPGSHRLNRQSTRDSTPAGATPTWASTPLVLASAEPGVILAGSHPSGR